MFGREWEKFVEFLGINDYFVRSTFVIHLTHIQFLIGLRTNK
jgi:hypothetical protein